MSSFSRDKKAFLWGLGFVSLGIVLILLMVMWEEEYPPTSLKSKLTIGLFTHIGIAALLLGVVGIIVEFKNWRDYFEERLASIIQKKEFLRTLERDELKTLIRNVFQAYYRVQNLIYEDSFLEFFNTKIQDYIASPFREHMIGMVTVNRPIQGICVVEEDISYRCRKVDVEASTIQTEAVWTTDYADIVGALKVCRFTLTLPESLPKNFSVPDDLKMDEDRRIIFDENSKYVKPVDNGQGRHLLLDRFKEVDELHVNIHIEYEIPTGIFFAWAMAFPSRGFQALFHYPEDVFEIAVETFGMDPGALRITKQQGIYALTYDSWLLPDHGLAYQFRELTAKPAATPQTVTVPAQESEPALKSEPSTEPAHETAIKPALEADAQPQPNHVKV
ncbi:MAG TPA: hypothetical protein VJ749_08410 [Pyrinomonadaceae bacterium]|jgi:hypothetical protein|nr:hypothetical protein [Pyrinomonadaceae bacterium]